MDKYLHVISFNVPYPADYGGVQDVYYKLLTLHKKGIKVILHCFDYGRGPKIELESYCEKVYYYKRTTGIFSQFHYLPYIVATRRDEALIENLLKDDYPILYEGLHCCYSLADARLRERVKIYRESNIEHHYYFHLFKAEASWFKKLYFLMEGIRLYIFQQCLIHAQVILAVSMKDADYLQRKFPLKRIFYLPSFIPFDDVKSLIGNGEYVLYHGNLGIAENYKAAIFLIEEVFSKIDIQFKIAGSNAPDALRKKVRENENISLCENPTDVEMTNLIMNAQVNVLITFQDTGLKLKLINALYAGRYCVVNSKMLVGTALQDLCSVGNTPAEIAELIKNLFSKPFSNEEIKRRKLILEKNYSNMANAQQIIQWVYRDN